MRTRLFLLNTLVAVFLAGNWAAAQVATGVYPFGTFDSKGMDTINVGNLNVHMTFPVLNKAGRGLPFAYNLSYDSSVYQPVVSGSTTAWTPTQGFGWGADSQLSFGYVSHTSSTVTNTIGYPPHTETCQITTYSNWVYTDPYGVRHSFSNQTTQDRLSCTGGVSSDIATATDGSGYVLALTNYTTATVTSPTGTQIVPSTTPLGSGTISDTNGNYISTDGAGHFTDTSGNIVLTVAGSAPSAHTFAYKDTNGNSQAVSMTYRTYTVQTAFGCSGITEYGPTSVSLVDTISYPDGSSYQFSYEPTPGASGNVTGRLQAVQLPQGGSIQYAYTGGSNGIVCADGSTAGLTRTMATTASSATSTQTYSRTPGTSTSHTEVVDGLSNHLAYDFVQPTNPSTTVTATFYETNRNVYQQAESGTPVLARQTCYNGASHPCTTTSLTLPIAQTDTYETLDGIETHGATNLFNASGQPTETDIYDFAAAPSRGSALRKEKWSYSSLTGLVSTDNVYDGSGTAAGETTYGYDHGTPTVSSGVPHHFSGTSSGNLTSVVQYANASTSYTQSATYEDTGSVLTMTTPSGTSTMGYDSSFVYLNTMTPPTPSSGVSLAATATSDVSYTGVPLTSTDANGTSTQYNSYDAMLRPLEIDTLDVHGNPMGKVTLTYPTYPLSGLPQAGQHVYQSSSVAADQETQYDSYGRTSRTAVANGQSTNPWYQQDTCYDGNGNASFVSYPYQGAGFTAAKNCSAASGDTYSYDVLGRVYAISRAGGTETLSYTYKGRAVETVDENGVTRISQVDGLGRPSIVCEISSNGSMPNSGMPGSCGTDIAGTGFTTTYAYIPATGTTIVTQGAQTRTFQTDWLGRTTSVTEPESGTTTYAYSYNSTGLVVVRTRPQANQTSSSVTTTTTTQYDAVGRPLSVTYSDGTPAKTYTYDVALSGSTFNVGFAKGSMTSASTGSTGATSQFSYDALGRVQSTQQCIPGWCSNPALNIVRGYGYDWASNPASEQYSTPSGTVSLGYTVNLAGQLLKVTGGQDASLTSLYNATQPLSPNGYVNLTLGNNVTSTMSYDTLGRPSGMGLVSGTNPLYAYTSTWKGHQLQHSQDSVNGTANYTYDEFDRLQTAGMTTPSSTTLNLTWGYDRYGNRLSQTGTGTYAGAFNQLSYSPNPANNQVQTAGFTYDAAGELMTAMGTNYTYDAEGNVIAVSAGSASYTYDALNQRVLSTVNGVTQAYGYNAAGQRATVWDGSGNLISAQYYAQGQPLGFYLASDGHVRFQHQDWMGTERFRTTYNGGIEGSFTSLPFGDSLTTASGADNDPYHFAGLDSDSQDLQHATFRTLSTVQGRWLRPDPYSGSYDGSNPQSFNRYAYVLNNPVAYVDPLGLDDPNVMIGCSLDSTGIYDCPDDEGGGGGLWSSIGNALSAVGGFLGNLFGGSGDPNDNGQDAFNTLVAGGGNFYMPANFTFGGIGGAPNNGCPANQRRFFANLPLYQGIAKQANTNVNFIMALSALESGWNGPHSQELNNLFGTTHAGGRNLGYASYQASATAWANSYSSWVNGATTINQFVGDLLNHVPPYNVNAYGDYATSILGGTFKNPALNGASTIGTYQSVLNYASACGVNP